MTAMASAGSLASLHRYPVKSMMGEELNAGMITERGLFGDRVYALRDQETGKVVSAKNPKKWPNFFNYRATFVSPPDSASRMPGIRVALPDGRYTVSFSSDFAKTLSDSLGRSVTLLEAAPSGAQLEEYWPDMAGLAHRDHVTDEGLPPGTFFDLATLHILTTATIDKFRELYPAGRFEPRRFRPNLIINTGDAKGFVENDWIGKTISIGKEVKLKVTGPCPRCVMTTLAQGDLPKDPGILKTAAEYNEVRIGIYASVLQPGTVHIGDSVAVQ
jgi:uncharacterized protein YcbX